MQDKVVLAGEWSAAIPQKVDLVTLSEQPVESVEIIIDGDADLSIPETAECDLLIAQDGEVDKFTVVRAGELPYYTGPVELTPSEETQILYTQDTSIESNITIKPIPSNYGLITWDGSVITVS